MRPLVVVDLVSHVKPFGASVVAAHHKYTDPDRPLVVVGADAGAAAWRQAFAGAAGIQISGSTCMVGEDSPWAPGLADEVVRAAQQGVPVLGVCFGHQMLGVHFGAELHSWDKANVGICPTTFVAGDRAGPFRDVAGEAIPVLYTHRDRLESLPPELVEVGHGGYGGVAAFAHRQLPIWGIQAHPEADSVLTREAEKQDVGQYSDAELDTPASKRILAGFGRLMRDQTPKTPAPQS